MEKFCNNLDINYIDKENKRNKNIIKEVFKKLYFFDIPKHKRHIYYIIYSYFYPSRIESHSNVTVSNFCNYFSKYKLEDTRIKNLFFTLYNQILLQGLKPDLSNISTEYLGKLFFLADEIYFTNLLTKFFVNEKNGLILELSETNKKIAGRCSKTGCSYVISINLDLHVYYFKTIEVQKANGIKCRNPLMCLISTFLHELVHLIMYLFCDDTDTSEHPPIFQDIAKSLFGHTSYEHSLGIDESIMGVTKYDLQNKRYISFTDIYINNFKYILEVQNIHENEVEGIVINGDNYYNRGESLNVPFKLIYKKEPTKEEINSLIGVTKNELIDKTYIGFIKRDKYTLSFFIAEINKIKIKNVSATIVKGSKSFPQGTIVDVPFTIIYKEEPILY
jgi:hypothetical protein